MIWPHHQQAIDNWTEYAQTQSTWRAIIVAGSLTKGFAQEHSDIDGFIIATDEEYKRRQATQDLFWYNTDLCHYPGGYFDIKVVPLSFLHEVNTHGSEPARSAFSGAQIPYSTIPELPTLCHQITTYPEATHDEKVKRFIAQILFAEWFIQEAEKRQDPYLLSHATSKLTLFTARLLLAHNRILYPYHKWLLKTLDQAPDKPANTLPLIHQLLAKPNAQTAKELKEAVLNHHPFPQPDSWPNQILLDSEWNWRDHEPPIEDI